MKCKALVAGFRHLSDHSAWKNVTWLVRPDEYQSLRQIRRQNSDIFPIFFNMQVYLLGGAVKGLPFSVKTEQST